jgi:hypothetical protein
LRGALKLRRRHVRRHRKRCLAFGALVGSGCNRFGDIGESSQGALGPHRFGFRTHLPDSCSAGILRRLTIRSSRPHVVASAARFTLR